MYSNTNFQLTWMKAVANTLRDAGYDVLVYESNTTLPHTSELAEPLDTVTLVDEFPSDPAQLRLLKDGESPKAHEIALPALAVQALDPRGQSFYELGSDDRIKERRVRIDGLAANKRQHRELPDTLYYWLEDLGDLVIQDYSDDPASPTPLQPVEILGESLVQERGRLYIEENEDLRYYLKVVVNCQYIE